MTPDTQPKKVNLSRLSHQTGYSLSHLSRLMSGKTTPSVRCLRAVSRALGLTMEETHDAISRGEVHVESY